ncbi:myb-like protein X isoform X2 [Clytia hemisphaerica]|uniref:myb-like protein X isoform X2 n=1 Tax=Clytia hemisphaerica TaxID=252671 RepID=UPI0034D71A95
MCDNMEKHHRLVRISKPNRSDTGLTPDKRFPVWLRDIFGTRLSDLLGLNIQTIPRLKEYAVIIDLINQSFEPDDSSSLQKLLGMMNDEFKNSKHSEKIKEYIKIASSAEKQDNSNIQSYLKKLVKQFLKEQQKPKLDTFMSVLLDEREKQRSTQHGDVEEDSEEAIPKSTMKRKRTRLISQPSSEEGGSERNSGNISSQTSNTKAVNDEDDDDDESQSLSRDEGHRTSYTRILRSRPQKIQGYQNKIRKRNSRSSPKPTNTLESSNSSDAKETSKEKETGTQKRTLANNTDQQLLEEKTAPKNGAHKRSLQRNALQERAGTDVIDDRSPKRSLRSVRLINKMDQEESNQKATQRSPKIRSSEVNHDEGDESDDEDRISLQQLQQKIASSLKNGQVNPVNQKEDHQKSLEDKVDENSCDGSLRGDRQPVTEDVDILSNSLKMTFKCEKSKWLIQIKKGYIQCPFKGCNWKFFTAYELGYHLDGNCPHGTYQDQIPCPHCDKSLPWRQLKQHTTNSHRDIKRALTGLFYGKTLKCLNYKCSRTFSPGFDNCVEYLKHSITCKPLFQCKKCKRGFRSEKHLNFNHTKEQCQSNPKSAGGGRISEEIIPTNINHAATKPSAIKGKEKALIQTWKTAIKAGKLKCPIPNCKAKYFSTRAWKEHLLAEAQVEIDFFAKVNQTEIGCPYCSLEMPWKSLAVHFNNNHSDINGVLSELRSGNDVKCPNYYCPTKAEFIPETGCDYLVHAIKCKPTYYCPTCCRRFMNSKYFKTHKCMSGNIRGKRPSSEDHNGNYKKKKGFGIVKKTHAINKKPSVMKHEKRFGSSSTPDKIIQNSTEKSPKIRSSEVNHDEEDKSDDENRISLQQLQQQLQQKIASSLKNGQYNPVNQKENHQKVLRSNYDQKSLKDKSDKNSCDGSLRGDRQPVTEDVDILPNTTQKSSDEMLPISVSQQHATEELNPSTTQRSLVDVSSTRTLRSGRLQDAKQFNPKPSQNPPEKLSSVTNDEIDDDEQEILREIEDELNSITTSTFSKMGEHFNEDPRDIEARFNDVTKRMLPYINASEENDINASEENDINASEENDINASEENDVNASEENDINASEENDVNASEENDVNASEENAVNASEENDVNASEENDVNASEENDVNASEENDVNASEENDDKRQKKNSPNGKSKAKSDQTKQRQTMAVQQITYTSKRKSLYGSPKKLLLTTSNKPSSPKKKRLQNTSMLELRDSQKESASPRTSTKCSERERNSPIIKRKTNRYHGDLDDALTQDEQDTDAGRNATSRNQNNSPVSLARTSREHDRHVSHTRSPNKRKSQPESSPISSRGGRTGSQPSSSREDVNNTRTERREEMQEEGESVQWDSIDDVDDDNNRNRRVGNRDVSFKKKSARVKFQAYEEKSLIAGIERFGVGDWNNILKHFKFHESRTNVALKDKYRTMKRQGLIQ